MENIISIAGLRLSLVTGALIALFPNARHILWAIFIFGLLLLVGPFIFCACNKLKEGEQVEPIILMLVSLTGLVLGFIWYLKNEVVPAEESPRQQSSTILSPPPDKTPTAESLPTPEPKSNDGNNSGWVFKDLNVKNGKYFYDGPVGGVPKT